MLKSPCIFCYGSLRTHLRPLILQLSLADSKQVTSFVGLAWTRGSAETRPSVRFVDREFRATMSFLCPREILFHFVNHQEYCAMRKVGGRKDIRGSGKRGASA